MLLAIAGVAVVEAEVEVEALPGALLAHGVLAGVVAAVEADAVVVVDPEVAVVEEAAAGQEAVVDGDAAGDAEAQLCLHQYMPSPMPLAQLVRPNQSPPRWNTPIQFPPRYFHQIPSRPPRRRR